MATRKSVKFSAKPAQDASGVGGGRAPLSGDFIPAALGLGETSPVFDPITHCGFVGRTVYRAVYAVSFGCVFGSMILARLLPGREIIAKGIGDGAHAAKEAAVALESDIQRVPAAYREAAAG